MADRIAAILDRMQQAMRSCGRVDTVELMAVSKTHPLEAVLAAVDCGQLLFGENRVQEIQAKFPETRNAYQVHLIGHLQSNKVRKAVGLVDAIDSVDSLKLVRLINAEALKLEKRMPILLEWNTSGETAKSGFTDEKEFFAVLDEAPQLQGVDIQGLMTIGPLTDNETMVRTAFAKLRNLARTCSERYPALSFDTLSMGMSQDFLWAIQEGSTMVRIGTAIFGGRDYQ
jgi:pyridoxal phosphate enzyme (YggS family)